MDIVHDLRVALDAWTRKDRTQVNVNERSMRIRVRAREGV